MLLNEFETGQRVRLKQISGDRSLVRRLLGLGLRNGVELDIVQFRSNGVVVARGETRIALGTGVADKLLVVPLEP
ncbi:MAG TPA: ferrous iron transport protein A [Gammaproteobacteria bacterium]|nr:ferrous iron transport protein A [Gammaproteobacteria bacterium]